MLKLTLLINIGSFSNHLLKKPGFVCYCMMSLCKVYHGHDLSTKVVLDIVFSTMLLQSIIFGLSHKHPPLIHLKPVFPANSQSAHLILKGQSVSTKFSTTKIRGYKDLP
jgi:hypothetical protein